MICPDFEYILQYKITRKSLEGCLEEITGWVDSGSQSKTLICANPHSLVIADKDAEFEKCFERSDLVTPDGIGIIYASMILGGKLRRRITGADIFEGLSRVLNNREAETYSYYFLGATDSTLEKIRLRLADEYSNIRFAGAYSPPFAKNFSVVEEESMVNAINIAKPDVLWVGMSAPKQEKWIFKNLARLDVKFVGAVGAVFDFYAGNVRRSPKIFRSCGFEWLPRLMQEPARLWKRNFLSNPMFMTKILLKKLKL